MCNNVLKNQIIERATKISSSKVKKYVSEGLIEKIDQAGPMAGIWIEMLEGDFNNLKPEGLMQGFTDSDFDDLFYVVTGNKHKGSV